jgi:hypothetical protein
MVTLASPSRQLLAWGFSLAALIGSAFGWLAIHALASFAAGTAWWLGAGFLASGPLAVTGLILALRSPPLSVPAGISGLALFLFVGVWIVFLAFKMAA